MTLLPTIRQNNPAELRAFDDVCRRLGGFDPILTFEWVDGFLTALAAGPQMPEVEAWLPALCDDAFERAFGDPESHAAALRALKTRLAVLRDQLDPEALLDQPDALRLLPLMVDWNDAERSALVASAEFSVEEAAELQTGAVWAEGFSAATIEFEALWPEPEAGDEMAGHYFELWSHVDALRLAPGSDEMKSHLAEQFPGSLPSRDELIDAACYAVQDLRVWWVDHAPRPATRRVEKAPGRNDPCPCGSGRKFKKCHGAAA
jgi:uncharacterized protein